MERMISFFKQLNLPKLVMVCCAGFALCLSTACSNPNLSATNPTQPNSTPVQMGANNNPYTMGNDSHGEPVAPGDYGNQAYKQPQSNAASLLPGFSTLIASSTAGQDTTGLLYESADQREGGSNETRRDQSQAYKPEAITARPQPVIDRSNPDEKIMEGIGKQFTEASKFLTDGVQPAVESAKVKTYTGSNQSVARQSEQSR